MRTSGDTVQMTDREVLEKAGQELESLLEKYGDSIVCRRYKGDRDINCEISVTFAFKKICPSIVRVFANPEQAYLEIA